jgi:hypothetical protein
MDSEGVGPFDTMLVSLRKSFSGRIPWGLSDVADIRLKRTLSHYIKEVARVRGTLDDREILRETFDSMAGWFRRNREQLGGPPRYTVSAPPIIEHAVSPEPAMDGSDSEDEDPMLLFHRLKAQREGRAAPPTAASHRVAEMASTPLSMLDGTVVASQPKDFLQPQENIVKYRETEYNIVLNSKDRDWLHSINENRYNFTVQLGTDSIEQGSGPRPLIQTRLRNIVRIEFVKVILPVEGLGVVIQRDCSNAIAVPEDSFYSVLGLPFLQIMMDDVQGNNVGTTPQIDKSLAICQYDSTWRSDHVTTTVTTSRGYTLFFPKLLKAQRVYAPTPLANLRQLSFQILNPENHPLSKLQDASVLNSIRFSNIIVPPAPTPKPCYADGSGDYIFIETTYWFPLWSYSKMDRVLFAGITTPTGSTGDAFRTWLERDEGHVIVGTSYGDISAGIVDGFNDCGYANWIIIRNRHLNPAIGGTCDRDWFSATEAAENTFATALAAEPVQCGGVLNLSRQVQIFLRVVTRDMDAATNIRPDNV